jgi:multiple sugar transport system substrate-binding protein
MEGRMRKVKFAVLTVFVLGIGFCLLTGCRSKKPVAASGGKTQLYILGLASDMDRMQTYREKYYVDHPDIEIVTEGYAHDQLFQVIEVKLGAGSTQYDIIQVDPPNIGAYTNRNYLLPLDQYFTKAEIAQTIPADIEGSTVSGKYMAAPLFTSCVVLLYNKDLLAKAGEPFLSEDPAERVTWEYLVESSRRIMRVVDPNGNLGIMGMFIEQADRSYQMMPLGNSLGAKGIADDGFTVDGVLNTPEWVKAAKFYYDLFNTWNVSFKGVTPDEAPQNFFAGKIAYFIGGTWDVNPAIEAGINLGYAPHPYFQGGKPVSPTGAWHYGISATTKHPDEAADFVKWITIGDGNKEWVELSGMVPAKVSTLSEIEQSSEYNGFPKSVWKIAAYEQKNTAVVRPVTPGFNEFESVIISTFMDIRNGSDPKSSLDGAVEQLNTAFKKYR